MKKPKSVMVGNVRIGGDSGISVQSMTTTDTKKADLTVGQIRTLEQAGCDIVRCALYDLECVKSIREIRENISIPLVGDVHFDSVIAIAAIENGIDKIRINPGNIGSRKKIMLVVDAAKAHRVPIRIGANAGSLKKELLEKHGGPTAEALVESVVENIRLLEQAGFYDIVVSIKSSSVPVCVAAYRKVASLVDYPLHLGVTEAGTYQNALIKSAIGLGALILDGIGNTMRVSITGDPVQEVYAAHDILKKCGMKIGGVEVIACPTCARCSLDIEKIATDIEHFSQNMKIPMKVAIMGCAVNGPGEARTADIGIAGGLGEALLFSRGKIIKKVDEFNILSELKAAVLHFQEEHKNREEEVCSVERPGFKRHIDNNRK
jgi:(E)-4-hydroxy-3-methylbut-2-enyl-diphosphate synthase